MGKDTNPGGGAQPQPNDDLLGQLAESLENEEEEQETTGAEETQTEETTSETESEESTETPTKGKETTEGADDEPPALFVNLVEEFGGDTEKAHAAYLQIKGVKPEEKAATEETEQTDTVVSEEAEWEFDQLSAGIETQQSTAKGQVDALVSDWNTLNREQGEIDRVIDTLTKNRKEYDTIIDTSEDRDEIRKAISKRDEISMQIADQRADKKAVAKEMNDVSAKWQTAKKGLDEIDAQARELKKVERWTAKYPVFQKNKPLLARLAVSGKIPQDAKYNDVIGILSAENVKAGGKPITATPTKKPASAPAGKAGTNPAIKESWRKTLATIRPVKGAGTVSTGTAPGKTKTAEPDLGAKYAKSNPRFADVLRRNEAEAAAVQNHLKGKKGNK